MDWSRFVLKDSIDFFIEVLEYNNWPWERDLSVHKSTLVGAPLFIRDGELVIFRDNDEPVKELTKDERRKLEKESQSRKR